MPEKDETIRIETWPMPTTRVAYPRNVVAFDEAGNELFRSISLWVLMDMESRAMILPGKSGIQVDGVVRGGELSIPGSLPPAQLSELQERSVRFTDLDINGHMNNCRYLDWAADLLSSDFHKTHTVKDFTIGYLSEAREGDSLSVHYQLSQEDALRLEITRQNTDGEHRIFAAQLHF
jgi:acyl-ACP thioesterase